MPLDNQMRRELACRLTKAVEPKYLSILANGGDELSESLWNSFANQCHEIAGQFESEKRSLVLFPIKPSRDIWHKFLYLGVSLYSAECRIKEGFIFGKTHDLKKRWAGYNSNKTSVDYFEPLNSWETGRATTVIEQTLKFEYTTTLEILEMPYGEAVETIERAIVNAGVPVIPTPHWQQRTRRSVWSREVVTNLLKTYRRRPDAN